MSEGSREQAAAAGQTPARRSARVLAVGGGTGYRYTSPAQANFGKVLVYRPGQEGVYTDPGPKLASASLVYLYTFLRPTFPLAFMPSRPALERCWLWALVSASWEKCREERRACARCLFLSFHFYVVFFLLFMRVMLNIVSRWRYSQWRSRFRI